MRSGFHIIKGDQTLLIIYKHTHNLRLNFQRQRDRGRFTSSVLIPIPHNYNPISILRTLCDHSLPDNGFSGHSYIPISLSFYLHFKIKSSWAETLMCQDKGTQIKPLWVISEYNIKVCTCDLFSIIRQNEFWKSCIRIQSHIHWKAEQIWIITSHNTRSLRIYYIDSSIWFKILICGCLIKHIINCTWILLHPLHHCGDKLQWTIMADI